MYNNPKKTAKLVTKLARSLLSGHHKDRPDLNSLENTWAKLKSVWNKAAHKPDTVTPVLSGGMGRANYCVNLVKGNPKHLTHVIQFKLQTDLQQQTVYLI